MMSEMHTIMQLADAKGTSITINASTSYENVLNEFHQAWVEQRLMQVGMERAGYIHRINPQQVVYIQQLEY